MQIRKLSPREVRSVLVVTLSTVILSTAMLIQPLGLATVWSDQPDDTAKPDDTAAVTDNSAYQFDPIDYFEMEPEFYSRSQQGYTGDPVQTIVPTTIEDFTGDFDPNDDYLPIPDNYNPVDEDEPEILEPINKPKGLVYTEAEYVLYIKANTLKLRAGPSTDTTVVATLKFGDQVICEGENDEWMKVRYDGQLGFLKTEYTSKTMVFRSVSETVYVSSSTLRLRAGPSVDEEILLTLSKNNKLTRTGIGDGWSRVKTSSGKTGYVASEYLTKTAPVVRTSSSSSSSSGSSSSSSSGSGVLYSGNAGRIVELAYKALGVRYVWGAESLSGMDCTGLTYWAYRQIGISVPRSTSGYYNAGVGVSYANIRPGDVIGLDGHPRDGKTTLNHVGIYVGNGKMIHASSRLGKVVLQDIKEYLSWGCKIITIRRFISG
jgi:cell wall-associated NlpC family hydrolase